MVHLKKQAATLEGEELQSGWKAVGCASSCRLWEHDVPPCSTTARVRALEWLRLAPKMHALVSVEQVERAMQTPHGDAAQAVHGQKM
jgi:hypothetical protein